MGRNNMANNNNNNEQLSIAQVFGEKSKDADEWADAKKIMLERLLSTPYKSDFTYEPREVRKSARIDPYLRDIKGGKEGEPYYLDPYGSDRSAYDILESMTFLMQGAEHPYQGSFRGESPAPGGNIGYPSKAQMQPMEKGKGLMSLLQRLIPGGKTGMK
tara:strand:- start:68 stop:544 length:477 start_codon:yes stop_codon:yes gene_type:complete